MIVAGIDIGSLSTDTVLLDDKKKVLTYSIVPTGASSKTAAEVSFEDALNKIGIQPPDVSYIVSTGYGREIVPFASEQVTEITCHGKGAHFLNPEVHTVIDVGGQDSKVIKVSQEGRVTNFVMNDKCAAGTGRFLEVMARALEVKLEEMGKISLGSNKMVSVSSMCTVFAESEVVSLIAAGHAKEDILNGINQAITNRIVGMVERVGKEEKFCMSGGVAKNIGVIEALEEKLGAPLFIPYEPQIVGALGAALIALEKVF